MNRRKLLGGLTATMVAASVAVAVSSAPVAASAEGGPATSAADGAAGPRTLARASAKGLIDARASRLKVSAHDGFRAAPVVSNQGLQYAAYERTYRGLPVVGGDFVVVTDRRGNVLDTSVAQRSKTDLASVTPQLSASRARTISTKRVDRVSDVSAPELVVFQNGSSHLAWSTRVTGFDADTPSSLSVYVDATNAKVLGTKEHVLAGDGTAAYSGPNPLHLDTTSSGGTYSMKDPSVSNLSCQDAANNRTFSGSDDLWGNGNATSRETGCVDALYSAQVQNDMLAQWLGRNGADGNGGAWPIRVGLNDLNAYYDGSQVQIGHNQQGQWIGSMDVLGHEFGHGIDDHTPGGISGRGTQEFIGDVFGSLTEAYANQSSQYDAPDYLVGEEINLVGQGPIRNMYNPSAVGDDNCYSSSTPTDEVHAAAGPGNHFFYLLAEGSSPGGGKPNSPTCNGSSVSGLGIQEAGKIMYNAMLMKTSSSSYLKYRTWTLTAAKNLHPDSCTAFNTVKAAWDAVSVPAQSADPTCTAGGGDPEPGGNVLLNPGFESGAVSWTGTAGPVTNNSGRPARTGSWKLWLGGNGRTATETISQSVSIPASASSAILSLWVRIDTSESSSTSNAYDTMKVQAVRSGSTATLATYSNRDATNSYVKKTFDLSAYKGSTVSVRFQMNEDASLQTSFVVDDTALDVT